MAVRTTFRILAGATTLALAAGLPARAAPVARFGAAEHAATWLAQTVDDAVGGPVGTLAYDALALAATPVGTDQGRRAVAELARRFDEFVVDRDGNDRPGALGIVMLAAAPYGADLRAFGGTGARHDLVARLLATKLPTGMFGAQNPAFDGTYRQALGLLGLAAAGVRDDDALRWLLLQQCSDGGWPGFNVTLVACGTAGPRRDVDSTAMAMMALAAWDTAPRHDALAFLRRAQNADGGFAFWSPGTTNANSTALAVQALVASGADPDGSAWAAAGGATPLDALLALQLDCSYADHGAFAYVRSGDRLRANAYATAQAIPAAALRAYPLPLVSGHRAPGRDRALQRRACVA